jgi:hypothetical protein
VTEWGRFQQDAEKRVAATLRRHGHVETIGVMAM